PERRTHQRADKDDIAASGSAREPYEGAQLADTNPVMRKTRDHHGISKAAKREKHDRAPALRNGVGDRQRKRAAPAYQREGAILPGSCRRAHASSSASPRLIAIVNGRFPARMKAMILSTRASPPNFAATASMRERNSPSPKNSAS